MQSTHPRARSAPPAPWDRGIPSKQVIKLWHCHSQKGLHGSGQICTPARSDPPPRVRHTLDSINTVTSLLVSGPTRLTWRPVEPSLCYSLAVTSIPAAAQQPREAGRSNSPTTWLAAERKATSAVPARERKGSRFWEPALSAGGITLVAQHRTPTPASPLSG